MKLVEFVPPKPHPLWKLCLQMVITDVIAKVVAHGYLKGTLLI